MKRKFNVFLVSIVTTGIVLSLVGVALVSQAKSETKVDVFISFHNTPGAAEHALVERAGGTVRHSYNIVPAVAASVPETAIQGLLNNPKVTSVELDGAVYAVDTELNNAWGVKRIGSGTVHDSNNKGIGVKIGIIDSGVNYYHPDLDGVYAGGHDFVQEDDATGDGPMDVYGHGTHVAGTACAEDNGFGVVGVAPECALYALRVLNDAGSGSWSDVVAAMDWAVTNGMQVVNLSLGSSQDPGTTFKAAFDNAEVAGLVIVAAGGNSGNPAGAGNNVIYPAKYASVIAVAATDSNDQRASFSSTGAEIELAAPGVSVLSTWNDATSPLNPQPFCMYIDGVCYYYKYGSGTSMASPHVAGVAALVIAAGVTDKNGNKRINDEVRAIMNSTAQNLGSSGRDPQYGYGLVAAAAAVAAVVPGPVDNPPLVSITNPLNGATISGTVLIEANATDDFGVVQVNFYVGVTLIGTDTVSPYSVSWDSTTVVDGTYTLTATAIDTASQNDSYSTTVLVDNVNDPPVANAGSNQIVSDTDGNGVESVTLNGSASYDPDGTIVSYEWTEGTTVLGTTAVITYNFAVGTHTVTLTVADDGGATGTDAVLVTISEKPTQVLCWSGTNEYLYRNNGQASKFCKCASGIYGYNSYTSKILRKAPGYQYVDTGDNENWGVASRSSNLPVYQVTCTDGITYPTNQDYYYPK